MKLTLVCILTLFLSDYIPPTHSTLIHPYSVPFPKLEMKQEKTLEPAPAWEVNIYIYILIPVNGVLISKRIPTLINGTVEKCPDYQDVHYNNR